MNGYFTQNGYWGLVDDEYMLFASDIDYFDYIKDQKGETK